MIAVSQNNHVCKSGVHWSTAFFLFSRTTIFFSQDFWFWNTNLFYCSALILKTVLVVIKYGGWMHQGNPLWEYSQWLMASQYMSLLPYLVNDKLPKLKNLPVLVPIIFVDANYTNSSNNNKSNYDYGQLIDTALHKINISLT